MSLSTVKLQWVAKSEQVCRAISWQWRNFRFNTGQSRLVVFMQKKNTLHKKNWFMQIVYTCYQWKDSARYLCFEIVWVISVAHTYVLVFINIVVFLWLFVPNDIIFHFFAFLFLGKSLCFWQGISTWHDTNTGLRCSGKVNSDGCLEWL